MLINRHPALLVLARKIWYLNGGILAEEKKKRERKNGGRRKGDEKNEHEHEGKGKKKRKSRGRYEMKRSIATQVGLSCLAINAFVPDRWGK